jgi:hypothetical protein
VPQPFRLTLTSFLLTAVVGAGGAAAGEPISIQLSSEPPQRFEVRGLSRGALAALEQGNWPTERWSRLFSVRVEQNNVKGEPPAILGSYAVRSGMVIFIPRFPLQPGLSYRASFDSSQLPIPGAERASVTVRFDVPKTAPRTATTVKHVYPSAHKLPENQLKFYLHFSAPMSRGEAYRHIHLLESPGKEVTLPFLELDEELWDRDSKRFTLFFDPGRIKRGLKPREDVGPSLKENKSYVLVIDRDWPDAHGNPLKSSYRKTFQVGPPDNQPPEPKNWKISAPEAMTSRPLIVDFGKPMDHALLARLLAVEDSRGERINGRIGIVNEESRWEFTPAQPWREGPCTLIVDTALEDLAGNAIGRPFEVDVFHPIQAQAPAKTLRVPFRVRK